MSDPVANAQLELACRLGSLDDVFEAIDDGADLNCNGSSPLFIAIQADDRSIVSALVEKGADVSPFEITLTNHEDVVEALMKFAPATVDDESDSTNGGMVDVDAKMVRAFDRMIRNKGMAEPILKGRGEEYSAFCNALGWIAAEDCQAIVSEFLELLQPGRDAGAWSTDDSGTDLKALVKDESKAARIAELSKGYDVASAEEVPCDLLKEYLKEQKRKKVA